MITTFSDYSQNTNTPLNNEQESIIEEYLESYTPKICCLESYWSQSMTDPLNVKPFLNAIGWMIEKEIVVAHRFIDKDQPSNNSSISESKLKNEVHNLKTRRA